MASVIWTHPFHYLINNDSSARQAFCLGRIFSGKRLSSETYRRSSISLYWVVVAYVTECDHDTLRSPLDRNASISLCSFVKSPKISGLASFLSSCIELVSLPFLPLSQLFLLVSPLVLRDESPCLGGGGGGGCIDALLLTLASITTLWGLSRDDGPSAGKGVGGDIGSEAEPAEELDCTDPRIDAGRRDGGGGGARPMSLRGVNSLAVDPGLKIFKVWFRTSASTLVDSLSASALVVLESGTRRECRLVSGKGGGVLRRMDCGGDEGSGTLPADSMSNIDWRSESCEFRSGAGGSGLLRSFGDRATEDDVEL